MRPLVIAAAFVGATSLLSASFAAAQDPKPQEGAVPRASAPAAQPAPQERRGAVRNPERAAERPARAEAPPAPSPAPNATTREERAVPRADAPASAAAAADEEQRGQRRGSVRQPPDDRGGRTHDRAVPRIDSPPSDSHRGRYYPHRYYYPNYSRYYDPWGYGSFGLGYFYYSPWGWGPYPGYYQGYGGGYGYDLGRVRLKVQPRDAEVWVDGYYAGTVDDFDGVFQALRLDSGGYHIEVRKPGFESLTFDVRVQPDRTVTFRGTMKPLP